MAGMSPNRAGMYPNIAGMYPNIAGMCPNVAGMYPYIAAMYPNITGRVVCSVVQKNNVYLTSSFAYFETLFPVPLVLRKRHFMFAIHLS